MKSYYNLLRNLSVELFLRVYRRIKISDSERLTRYIFSNRHIKANQIRPKYAAFIPNINVKNGKLETSVFRISGLTQETIWYIGEFVETQRSRKSKIKLRLKGYARLLVKNVKKYGLNVEIETTTHKLHANIINWPQKKEEQIELAILLANSSIRKMK